MIYNNKLPTFTVFAKTIILSPKEKIWKTISLPGNLINYHPFCKSNKVELWNGIGSKDTIEYYNGLRLKRIFIDWNENNGYELIIGYGKLASAKVNWEIIDCDNYSAELKITIKMIPNIILKKYPKLFHGLLIKYYLKPNMKKYVESVVNGIKYHIQTGDKITINQFGYNSMFSRKNI